MVHPTHHAAFKHPRGDGKQSLCICVWFLHGVWWRACCNVWEASVRAGDRVVVLLKGSHGGRCTGKCESQGSGKMSLSATSYYPEDLAAALQLMFECPSSIPRGPLCNRSDYIVAQRKCMDLPRQAGGPQYEEYAGVLFSLVDIGSTQTGPCKLRRTARTGSL